MSNSVFDVAFSFAAPDAWVAKDMKVLLEYVGVNSYLSETLPDKANGELHAELMKLYRTSLLNVVILSQTYASKPKDSVVELEKKVLFGRHVTKGDEKSLFILNIDGSETPSRFDGVTFHPVTKCGITGAVSMITDRLIQKWHTTDRSVTETTPCHPVGIETLRGPLQPCEFEIVERFETDSRGRWQTLGDVLVEGCGGATLRNEFLSVYLIPSGRVPTYLAHSTLLKTRPELLRLKKALIKEFEHLYSGQRLRGDLFYIRKDGVEYPHVYSAELDAFFIRNHRNFSLL